MTSYILFLDWIHSQEQILLSRVKQWADINTFSWNTKGLNQLLTLMHASFQFLPEESHYISLPPQKILGSDQRFHIQQLGSALVMRKRPQASIQVLLGGHIDTVYPLSSSFQKVEEISPGLLRGPGVADMKGGLVILFTALEALERSPFAEQIGWEVIINPDEEMGSPGSVFIYEEAARRHHCGLIFEPSFPDGTFVSQRKGSATYTLAVKGKAAHVGRDYAQGRSAVFVLAHLIHKLESLRLDPDLFVNVADVEGRGPVNVVPPLASCRINFRSSNANTLEEATKKLQQFIKESQEEGINIEMHQDSFRLPKPFNLPTQHLFEAYAQCAHDLDISFQTCATGGVCDGNILASAGLPNLDTAGVIGGALHTPDEYMICSSLVERAKLAALFLFKLATRDIIIEKGKSHAK